MTGKWEPQHWFLESGYKDDYDKEYIVDPLKELDLVCDDHLLSARSTVWGKLNDEGWQFDDSNKNHLLKSYTGNNEVEALIDGEKYMGDLYEELTNLPPGRMTPVNKPFALIAGWEFTGKMKGTGHTGGDRDFTNIQLNGQPGSELDQVLVGLISGDAARVRLLAFDNGIPFIRNNNLVDALNNAPNSNQVSAFLDNTVPGFATAYHEKLVLIGNRADWDIARGIVQNKGSVAYVGGMDLALDRRDNRNHDGAKEKHNGMRAWHDIAVKISGPATSQIWADFAERWESHDKKWPDKRLKACPGPRSFVDGGKQGNKYVQVLRTIPPAPTNYKTRYRPNGERTVLCGLAKAISRARRYIYIEDQYLWDCELADFIRREMAGKKDLYLIVVVPGSREMPDHLGGLYQDHKTRKFFRTVMGLESRVVVGSGRSDDEVEFSHMAGTNQAGTNQDDIKNRVFMRMSFIRLIPNNRHSRFMFTAN
jgi:hypothetical protein